MNGILLIIALMLVVSAIVAQQKKNGSLPTNQSQLTQEANPSATSGVTPTLTKTSTPSPKPTVAPVPTDPPAGTNDVPLDAFHYSNSTVKSQTRASLFLESTDAPESITSWYIEKIKNARTNTRSFVQTNTNGNVNNVLAAASSNVKISITIKKSASASIASIDVSLQNY